MTQPYNPNPAPNVPPPPPQAAFPQALYPGQPFPPGQPYPVQPLNYSTPVSPYGAAVVCPKCRDPRSTKVSFTWWGGLLGPRMMSHVKCMGCGTCYNGKTGKSNTTGILIYTFVVLGIVLAFIVFRAMS